MKNNILIIGNGGHAKACIDIIENQNKYKIYGMIDNKKTFVRQNDYKIFESDNFIEKLKDKIRHALIGIGQIKSPNLRIKVYKKLKINKYNLPVIISKFSSISKKSNIKEGVIVMNFANIGRNTNVGLCSIINTKANLEHDVTIGNFCHISTGTILNGNVQVGNNTFIGSGVVVDNNIKIGNNCIIGSGKIIKKNIKSGSIVK